MNGDSVYTKVRKLDKHKCRVWGCGSAFNVEVHHIIPRSQGGPDEPWNLICLCPKHHRLVTMNKLTDIELLSLLTRKSDYRWKEALAWHIARETLHDLRKS